jgi:hypothetical protein
MQVVSRIHGRPCVGESRSGDAGLVREVDGVTWVVLVDALGHGNEAADVADLAIATAEQFDAALSTEAALTRLHAALAHTRGAAAALLRFSATSLSLTGVGNVEVRTLRGDNAPYIAARGVLGRRLPPTRANEIVLHGPGRLLLYTDGIDRRVPLHSLANLDDDALCTTLLRDHALDRDDAMFIHLRYSV